MAQNPVVLECPSGVLCVGDLINRPARYAIPLRGVLHCSVGAIVAARKSVVSFSVDNGQIFFIDADYYDAVAAAVSANGNAQPNRARFAALRDELKTQFGGVIARELADSAFDADGTYALEVALLQERLLPAVDDAPPEVRKLLCQVISRLNTLVCGACLSEKIMEHPELGVSPMSRGRQKREWSEAMADHALQSGWTARRDKSPLGDVMPNCPACQERRPL